MRDENCLVYLRTWKFSSFMNIWFENCFEILNFLKWNVLKVTLQISFKTKFSSLGNLWKLGSRASSPAGTAGETRTSLFKQGISNGDPNKGIRTRRSKQGDNARVAWQLSSAQTELSSLREYPRHQWISWVTWNYLRNDTVGLNRTMKLNQ